MYWRSILQRRLSGFLDMIVAGPPLASRVYLTACGCFFFFLGVCVGVRWLEQVGMAPSVSPADLTSALEAIGFPASCIASTTTEEPTLEQDGVNAVWAIASALGG